MCLVREVARETKVAREWTSASKVGEGSAPG